MESIFHIDFTYLFALLFNIVLQLIIKSKSDIARYTSFIKEYGASVFKISNKVIFCSFCNRQISAE